LTIFEIDMASSLFVLVGGAIGQRRPERSAKRISPIEGVAGVGSLAYGPTVTGRDRLSQFDRERERRV
jgi:hypothetical protein